MRAPRPKRFAAGIALVTVLAGCASSGMPMSFQRTIPRGATTVELTSGLDPSSLFDTAQALLVRQGFSFPKLDSAALTLETDALPVGRTHSALRLSINVDPAESGAVLAATGQTLVGPGLWGPASNSDDDKARLGFEEMVMLLGQIPNREVKYSGAPFAP